VLIEVLYGKLEINSVFALAIVEVSGAAEIYGRK